MSYHRARVRAILDVVLDDARFLAGVALLRGGSWYAAHDALEAVWLGAEGERRAFLGGLIHGAIAHEHLRRGNALGCFNVWSRAKARLAPLEKLDGWDGVVDGVGVAAWCAAMGPFFEEARLADRVKAQLEGGIAAGAEHLDASAFPPLPPDEDWPLPPLSDV